MSEERRFYECETCATVYLAWPRHPFDCPSYADNDAAAERAIQEKLRRKYEQQQAKEKP